MTNLVLLEQLAKATDKAATLTIQRGMPITTKSGAWVGSTCIKRNINGLYDISTLDKKQLFNNILVFDVAVIISQRYSSGEFRTVEKVLVLESKFAKYHADMLHYLHCIKGAKKRRDYDTMAILEDKFQISEIRAKHTRDDIAAFKRVK
jgi:hypothetical protein